MYRAALRVRESVHTRVAGGGGEDAGGDVRPRALEISSQYDTCPPDGMRHGERTILGPSLLTPKIFWDINIPSPLHTNAVKLSKLVCFEGTSRQYMRR